MLELYEINYPQNGEKCGLKFRVLVFNLCLIRVSSHIMLYKTL